MWRRVHIRRRSYVYLPYVWQRMDSAGVLKQGTRVKNIRLITDASDGHDIDCKIDGFGAMALKSEMVKKI